MSDATNDCRRLTLRLVAKLRLGTGPATILGYVGVIVLVVVAAIGWGKVQDYRFDHSPTATVWPTVPFDVQDQYGNHQVLSVRRSDSLTVVCQYNFGDDVAMYGVLTPDWKVYFLMPTNMVLAVPRKSFRDCHERGEPPHVTGNTGHYVMVDDEEAAAAAR